MDELVDALKRQLALFEEDEQGISRKESLLQVLRTIPEGSETYNNILEELDVESKIPACLQHIWEWFWELRRTAGSGFATPNPITFTEIYNWARLKGITIYPFEVEIIKRLDDAFIEYSSKQSKKKIEKKKK